MVAATAAILVLAGLVEGGFSQFSSKTFPYPLKESAEAEVKRLTEEEQVAHHLRAEKVPFDS